MTAAAMPRFAPLPESVRLAYVGGAIASASAKTEPSARARLVWMLSFLVSLFAFALVTLMYQTWLYGMLVTGMLTALTGTHYSLLVFRFFHR